MSSDSGAGRSTFGFSDIPALQILKYPAISSLANHVIALVSKVSRAEEYNPIIPFQLTGNKIPILFVYPGITSTQDSPHL